jgi:chromatin remodeling complex protein RSC6
MKFFKKKRQFVDPTEEKFDSMMSLIKDLSRGDYNRLKDAMDMGYNAYQKVRNVKTADEKESGDIDEIASKLEKESR